MTPTHAPVDAPAQERIPPAPDRLPTLTEVVELAPELALPDDLRAQPLPPAPSETTASAAARPGDPPPAGDGAGQPGVQRLAADRVDAADVDASALAARVLADLQPRIDALFEARVREAVAPALARAADALIRDARQDLAVAMRELVEEAVARVLQGRDRH